MNGIYVDDVMSLSLVAVIMSHGSFHNPCLALTQIATREVMGAKIVSFTRIEDELGISDFVRYIFQRTEK